MEDVMVRVREQEVRSLEAPRGVTWDLMGWKGEPWQAANYLHGVGFIEPELIAQGVAIMMAESALFDRAWNLNVKRQDGKIVMDGDKMFVSSADLGWIQKNIPVSKWITRSPESARSLVDSLFAATDWDRWIPSAREARRLYLNNGWLHWIAFTNGAWKTYRKYAALGVGRYVANELGLHRSVLTLA